MEGQSAFVGWPFSFFLHIREARSRGPAHKSSKPGACPGVSSSYKRSKVARGPGPVPDRAGTSARSARAGPKDQEQAGKGPGAKDQEQTSTCAYKIYLIE